MPCCSCTTGSPMRTSERSRSIASTFVRRAASRRSAPHDAGVELGFGDERELRLGPQRSPACSGAGDERAAARRRREERRESSTSGALQAVLGEVLLHRLAPARAFGARSARARRSVASVALERGQRIVGAPVDLHRRQRLASRRSGGNAAVRSRGGDLDAARTPSARRGTRRAAGTARVGGKQRPRLVAAQQPVARLGVLPEALDRRRRRRRCNATTASRGR